VVARDASSVLKVAFAADANKLADAQREVDEAQAKLADAAANQGRR
jgi:hypothetical protein